MAGVVPADLQGGEVQDGSGPAVVAHDATSTRGSALSSRSQTRPPTW
ncbi:hypothetical protein [Streptomyces sp. NBC_01214]|nr:hypothetical protein [Streptomyces sp. NBC_01214]